MPDKPNWLQGELKDFSTVGSDPAALAMQVIQKKYSSDGKLDSKKFIKDFGVDLASQAPLMLIPEAGMGRAAVRAGASLLSGFGADQLLNKDKSVIESGMDAATNTGVSMAIPGLIENAVKYAPTPTQGTGVSALPLKLLNLISPSSYNVTPRMMPTGPTTAIPQNLGNMLKFKGGFPGLSAEQLNYILKNGFGLGANTALDSTLNKPTVAVSH